MNQVDLIRLERVSKTYRMGNQDVPVLKGLSMTIGRGEFVALKGVSGSGKSTLMNILGCLDHPTGGAYWLDGIELAKLSRDGRAQVRCEKIGFVFQNFNLLPRTSALDNVILPLSYAKDHVSGGEAKRRGVELLSRFGLSDRLEHHPSQLSGGQQQRVAISRALINGPSLLLADEPTGNLDSRTSEEVLAIFQQLNREMGLTIILVTHEEEVAQHAQRTIRLHDGLIVSEREGE